MPSTMHVQRVLCLHPSNKSGADAAKGLKIQLTRPTDDRACCDDRKVLASWQARSTCRVRAKIPQGTNPSFSPAASVLSSVASAPPPQMFLLWRKRVPGNELGCRNKAQPCKAKAAMPAHARMLTRTLLRSLRLERTVEYCELHDEQEG
jgi:hypothetical protein